MLWEYKVKKILSNFRIAWVSKKVNVIWHLLQVIYTIKRVVSEEWKYIDGNRVS